MILDPTEEEGRRCRQPPHAIQQAHCCCPPPSAIAVVLPRAHRFSSGVHRRIATFDKPLPPPPSPALLLPLSSWTAALSSLSPLTGNCVFCLPLEGGGGQWPLLPIRRSPPPSPDSSVISLPDNDPAAGPLSLIGQNGGPLREGVF